jgi:hypothetical protein
MTSRFWLCLLLGMPAAPLIAEPPRADSAILESPSKKTERDLSPYLVDKLDLKPDVIQKKHFRLGGPLVRPFKGRLREAPRRFLHVINPFAPSDAEAESGAPRTSAQAWSTTVGWSTGPAGSDTAITHESKMGLVTLGK